jgi:nucleoside-triphosphatase THEP1
MKAGLSETWIKASITGTMWAASEIVLGSFLHNLRVPFSGNILTAIGIVILVSVGHIWRDRGIFWRAGLICALMKTMSPSAIIFGPMIAIFAESLLLELPLRLLGRSVPAYLLGAILAMSWNLFQKIANYIIIYGSNIIEVYNNLLRWAQKQLNIQTDIVWLPIIFLLVVFAIFGLLAGMTGIMVGRKMLRQPDSVSGSPVNKSRGGISPDAGKEFSYSLAWLFFDILLMIFAFLMIYHTPWYVWTLVISGMVTVWSIRYKRAVRQLSRPKFWLFFVFVTLITAFAFTVAKGGDISWQQGLLTGIQMNFRAVVIVVGFASLGTELYNPVIREFFQKTAFKNVPLALELSVESLPLFISSVPDLKSLMKKPVSIFYNVISQADRRLSEIRDKKPGERKIFIVSGPRGKGKTTFLREVADLLRKKNLSVSGIIAEALTDGRESGGYDIVNLETGERLAFLRNEDKYGNDRIGRFYICPEGLEGGKSVFTALLSAETDIVVIDEVGRLELRGQGWHDPVTDLLGKTGHNIIMTVRREFVEKIRDKWNLENVIVFDVRKSDPRKAVVTIVRHIMPDSTE